MGGDWKLLSHEDMWKLLMNLEELPGQNREQHRYP